MVGEIEDGGFVFDLVEGQGGGAAGAAEIDFAELGHSGGSKHIHQPDAFLDLAFGSHLREGQLFQVIPGKADFGTVGFDNHKQRVRNRRGLEFLWRFRRGGWFSGRDGNIRWNSRKNEESRSADRKK